MFRGIFYRRGERGQGRLVGMIPTLAAVLVCPVLLDTERAPVGYARHLAGVDVVLNSPPVAGFSGTFDGRDLYALARPDDADDAPEWALYVPAGIDPARLVNARCRVRVILHPPGRGFRAVREVRVGVLE